MFPSFQLFGETIFSYALMLGLAWGVGLRISGSLIKLSLKDSIIFYLGLFLSSWFGAKLFFLMTSFSLDVDLFIKSSNFWLGGGFVFYGGLIFSLLFLFLFSKAKQFSISKFSPLVISLGLAHGIGRIGCFLAGCCHGVVLEFSQVSFHTPVQIFEAIILFVLSYLCYKRLKVGKEILFFYLQSYAISRFILEFLRADEIRGIYLGLSTSQIISILIVGICAYKAPSQRLS